MPKKKTVSESVFGVFVCDMHLMIPANEGFYYDHRSEMRRIHKVVLQLHSSSVVHFRSALQLLPGEAPMNGDDEDDAPR